MGCLDNVIELNKSNGADAIRFYLRKIRSGSENTYKGYKDCINKFFNFLFNKNYDYVTDEELKTINYRIAEDYLQNLLESKLYKKNTLDKTKTILNCMFEELKNRVFDCKGEIIIKENPIGNYKYKGVIKDKKSSGGYTRDEVLKMLELIKQDGDMGLYLYVELLFLTGVRKSACKEVTLSSFHKVNNDWYMRGIDKNNKQFDKKIRHEIYELAKSLADDNGIIFRFSENYAYNKICVNTTYHKNGNIKTNYENTYLFKIGVSEQERIDRKLTLHSFRKASGQEIARATNNDVHLIAEHLGHENIDQVLTYTQTNKHEDTTDLISLEKNETLDLELENKLQSLDKKSLIALLMKLNDAEKISIVNKLSEKEK